MPVTKTDWSQPASAGVNEGQSAEAARYQAMADYYRPGGQGQPLASGAVYAGGSPAIGLDVASDPMEQIQANLAEAAAQQMAAELQGAYQGVTNFGMGPAVPLGSDIYPDTFSALTPGQQASLNQYLQRGPGQDYSFGMIPKIMGLLGAPTKYEQITSGDYRPVFVGDEFYGSFGAGPFGGQVYTGRTLPSDVAAEYGIPGFEDTSSDPEVVAPVADVTGQPRCPEGYIFDEDLQACRLDTSAPVMQPLEQRTPTRTYSLLDQAPDGLLEFQRRYGLPQQQMDFSLLT